MILLFCKTISRIFCYSSPAGTDHLLWLGWKSVEETNSRWHLHSHHLLCMTSVAHCKESGILLTHCGHLDQVSGASGGGERFEAHQGLGGDQTESKKNDIFLSVKPTRGHEGRVTINQGIA